MIGDKIHIKEEYLHNARKIKDLLESQIRSVPMFVITIGGESGSGKSVTASCLKMVLDEANIPTLILHQDDYFFLPPYTNHKQRLLDITHVGKSEVNFNLLQEHVNLFLQQAPEIKKPIVDYQANEIHKETVSFENIQCLIIEGTYVLDLQNSAFKIFIERTYIDTLEKRKLRARDIMDDFGEKVLEIEHHIIREMSVYADLYIQKDYSIRLKNK